MSSLPGSWLRSRGALLAVALAMAVVIGGLVLELAIPAIDVAGGRAALLAAGSAAVGALLACLLLLLWWRTMAGEASGTPGPDRRGELGRLAIALAASQRETAHREELANAVAAETAQQTRTLELLNHAVSAMSGVLEPLALDQVVCQSARDLLGGADTLLVRRSREGGLLSVVTHEGGGSPPSELALDEGGLIGQTFRTGRPLVMADGTRSVATVPLVSGDHPPGVLAASAAGERSLDERDLRVLALLAGQAAPAMEAARLHAELVTAHRDLTRTNEELARASRHKSDFLASVSHEVRTPLNSILGFSELLLDSDDSDPAKRAAFLRNIHGSGLRLLGLINDILDLAKVEAGQMELRLETVDLAGTIAAALSTMEPLADHDGVELVVDCPGPLVLRADDDKVQQMLFNLLSNAIRFTPRGGRVTVRARRRAEHVLISVADTGIGIATEDQARIFEEFQQVDARRERRRPGTGLGLTLTRRLVELHGGRIWVESEPGAGSRFLIELPAASTLRGGPWRGLAMPETRWPLSS